MLFYTVFKFFEQRNLRMRGNPRFAQGKESTIILWCCPLILIKNAQNPLVSRFSIQSSRTNILQVCPTAFKNSLVFYWCLHRLTFTVKKEVSCSYLVQLLPDSLEKCTLNLIEKIHCLIWTIDYLLAGEHCEQYVRHFEDLFGQEAFATTASA